MGVPLSLKVPKMDNPILLRIYEVFVSLAFSLRSAHSYIPARKHVLVTQKLVNFHLFLSAN